MSETAVTADERIPDAVLAEQWFGLVHRVIGELQIRFRQSPLTQKDVARRIGRKPSFVSRCLSGQQNMTLRTLHDIARAMDCRIDVAVTPLASLRPSNHQPTWPSALGASPANENIYNVPPLAVSAARRTYVQG